MRRRKDDAEVTAERTDMFLADGQGNVVDNPQVVANVEQQEPTTENTNKDANVPTTNGTEVAKVSSVEDKKEATTPNADDIIKGVYQPNLSFSTTPLQEVPEVKPVISSYQEAINKGVTAENLGVAKSAGVDTTLPKVKMELPKNDVAHDALKKVMDEQTKTPKTEEEVEAVEETKPQVKDALLELFQSQKPNVLKDLGLSRFKDYNAPDDLLNYYGKNLRDAIGQITDKDRNPISEEDRKKILRRIRGVRAGDALMKIANIAAQAYGVSQGGTPVKMDNSTILGNIHKNAQAKKDAWIKQMLDYKKKQDENNYKMFTANTDWQKAVWDNQNKQAENKINTYKAETERGKAQADYEYKQGLLSQKEYSNQTARIKANNDALKNGTAEEKAEAQKEINYRKDYRIIYYNDAKGQRRAMVVAYNDLQQMYSALGGDALDQSKDQSKDNAYALGSLGGQSKDQSKDKDFKLLAKVTQLINEKGIDAVKRYAINDKERIKDIYKAYGKKVTFSNGD